LFRKNRRPQHPHLTLKTPHGLLQKRYQTLFKQCLTLFKKYLTSEKRYALAFSPQFIPPPQKHIAGAMICGIWEIIIFANGGATHAFRPASPAVLSVKTKKHSLLFRV